MFKRGKQKLIINKENYDFSQAIIGDSLSLAGYEEHSKLFYVTTDKLIDSTLSDNIEKVLSAHGYVENFENILSCLDSFRFAAIAIVVGEIKVKEYMPCITFQLPQKENIGYLLGSYYSQISNFNEDPEETEKKESVDARQAVSMEEKYLSKLEKMEQKNEVLERRVKQLSSELGSERRSLTRISRALESQKLLPENTRIGRVERVDLRRRTLSIKISRSVLEVPMQMVTRIPNVEAKCILTFDDGDNFPSGIFFYQYDSLKEPDKRLADILAVDDKGFKARDSKRNLFQIKAENKKEKEFIQSLNRGKKIMVYLSEGYVIRFGEIETVSGQYFIDSIEEEVINFYLESSRKNSTDKGTK